MKQTDDIGAIHAAASEGLLFYLLVQPVRILTFNSRLRDLGVASDCIRVDDWE